MQNVKNTLLVGKALLGKVHAGAKRISVLALVLAAGAQVFAQDVSYNLNGAGIGGVDNTGIGFNSCPVMAAGSIANCGLGKRTLLANTTGTNNTAIGSNSLSTNIAGHANTAVGFNALQNNTASDNTAVGAFALLANVASTGNVAVGFQALNANTGASNTATGSKALIANVGGGCNTANGNQALQANVASSNNSGFGCSALSATTGGQNTAVGAGSMTVNTVGTNNTGLGYGSNTGAANLTNATALGNGAIVSISDKVRIGNAAVTTIEGQVAYTWPSDARFKFNVTEEVKGIDFITKLRPVVYNFDTRKFQEFLSKNMSEFEKAQYMNMDFGPSTAVRQSGFIAQEVEQVAKQVGYDFNGLHKPSNENDNYSLAYAEFVVPLVKAVQEQQQMITTQQQEIAALQRQVAVLASAQTDAAKVNAVNGVKMYPNPSEGLLTISTPALESATIEVYDMGGARVYQAALKTGATTHAIDLSAYPRGMYSVKVMANGKEVSTQKVVLQ